MTQLIKLSQVQHAVVALRQSVRSIDLAEAFDCLERELEMRYGAWLPMRYTPARSRDGRFKVDPLLEPLRLALAGSYRPAGRSALSPERGACMDEVSDALGFSDPEEVVADLTSLAGRAQALRGRGGRYGAISNGLSSLTLELIDTCGHDWLLTGGIRDTAKRVHKEAQDLLLPLVAGESILQLARAECWQLQAHEDTQDEDYAHLARSYGLYDQPQLALIEFLLPHLGGTSWFELLKLRLRMRATTETLAFPKARVMPVTSIAKRRSRRLTKLAPAA